MHPSVGTVAVVLSWLLLVSAPNAAEIHASSRVILGTPYPDICYLYIVGDIEAGDGEKFRLTALEAIRDGCTKIDRVTIYSPRGNLMEAMAIGEQVSVLGASTYTPSVSTFVVDANPKAKSLFKDVSLAEGKRTCVLEPDDWEAQILMGKKPTPRKKLEYHPVTGEGDPRCTCASACFFIWAAGARRIGGFIQIHRPYLTPDKYARLSLAEAKAVYEEMAVIVRAYLQRMDVPEATIRRMFSVSSQEASLITAEEDKLMRLRPYRSELVIARCGKMPGREVREKAYKYDGKKMVMGDEASFEVVSAYTRCLVEAEKSSAATPSKPMLPHTIGRQRRLRRPRRLTRGC